MFSSVFHAVARVCDEVLLDKVRQITVVANHQTLVGVQDFFDNDL